MPNDFFAEQKMQSQVKSAIVSKYFDAWASVITGAQNRNRFSTEKKIVYIDLFAGPGRYKDGTDSTPLMVLQKAIKKPVFRERLVCVFNDKDESNTQSLESAIRTLPGIELLKNKPIVHNQEIGTEIVKMFEKIKLAPTLFFVDPWGYKGLSLRLINSVLKDWGCDCIFFFNYTRISMGVPNPHVKEHIDSLFGAERAETVRRKMESVDTPQKKELLVIEELCSALKEMGGKFTLPFRFKASGGKRTIHHLIFVSKDIRGYEIMKEIMAKEASRNDEGVSDFEYNPIYHGMPEERLLFKLSRPIADLGDMLLAQFSGKTLKMIDVYQQHNVDTPYIKKNYKDALLKLEKEGKVTVGKHKKTLRKETYRVQNRVNDHFC